MPDKKISNRLIHQKNPYLLQHADNPVDWYPWGEEAFQKAKEEDKPVFLSIGYSTCHWCHVMEHESFENDKIAAVLNQYFVAIKVDREERPDIDNIYMKAAMAMTGQGGWPLSVFLTPDKKPFYAGTYFPPEAKWGSPGFIDVLESIHGHWQTGRDKIIQSSDALVAMIESQFSIGGRPGESDLDKTIFDQAFAQFERSFDRRYGGFQQAPKFPMGHNLSFLLRYWRRTGSAEALAMVTETLKSMSRGGIHDHLGGGFHRYSTDQQWQVPHFEKMLYDQALLSRSYLEAYQITGNEDFAQVAREIFDYVLRDMQSPAGGFYSAEDADSYVPEEFDAAADVQELQKKEGAFYLWRETELEQLLSDDAPIVIDYFNVKKNGNALQDPQGEFTGKNILHVVSGLEELAEKHQKPVNEIKIIIGTARQILLKQRNQRPRPHLDDKVIVDWNGLMISSLALGADILHDERYRTAAQKAADFILKKLVDQNNRLLHRYRDGEAAIPGTIEDYAFFTEGLLNLYEATFEGRYLEEAIGLAKKMLESFWDQESGGFYFTSTDAEQLILRQKEIYDGAIPSGNSMAALVLVKLYHFTLDSRWQESYEKLFSAFADKIKAYPNGYCQMLNAYGFAVGPSSEIVFAGIDAQGVAPLKKEVLKRFLPDKIMLLHTGKASDKIGQLALFVESQTMLDGKPTVYVCENHVCRLPATTKEALNNILDSLARKEP